MNNISEFFISSEYFNKNPNDKYEIFWNIITENLNARPNDIEKLGTEFISNRPSNYKRTPAPWWNSEYLEIKKDRIKALLNARRTGNMNDFIEWKRISAITRKTFKSQKTDFYCICRNYNPITNPSSLCKEVKTFKNKSNASGKNNAITSKLNYHIHIE